MSLVNVEVDASGGLDMRLSGASENSATNLTNVRWADDLGGMWSSDIGWGPLIPDSNVAGRLFHPTEFFSCRLLMPWRDWLLTEFNGALAYRWWNRGLGAVGSERVQLASGRYVPAPGEAGTVAIDCGQFVLLVNGHDRPLKWFGGRRTSPFGFAAAPSAPELAVSDPAYWGTDPFVVVPTWHTNSPSLGFPDVSPLPVGANDPEPALGLGTTNDGSISSYDYVRTWLSDTGSESPPSSRATVWWQQPASGVSCNRRRLGVFAELDGDGAPSTNIVGHRLYRTGNRRSGNAADSSADSTLYLVAQVLYGGDVDVTDVLPDQAAIGQPSPPSVLDAIVLPAGITAGAMWDGRLWLTDGQRIYGSERGELERFSMSLVLDVGLASGSGSGGSGGSRVVALTAHGGVLVVFMDAGLAVLKPSTAPTAPTPYQFVNVDASSGSGLSGPNAVTAVPGLGLMWLGTDGLVWSWDGSGDALPTSVVSDPVHRVLSRVTAGVATAWAVYSPLDREVWFHVPVDGQVLPTLGVVLHLGGETLAWSLRGWTTAATDPRVLSPNPVVAGVSDWRSCFTAAAVTGDGRLLLGCGPYNALGDVPPNQVGGTRAAGDLLYNVGVQVWGRGGLSGWGRLLTGWAAVVVAGETWWSSATRSAGSSDGSQWAGAWVVPADVLSDGSGGGAGAGGAYRRALKVDFSVLSAGVRSVELRSGLDGFEGVWSSERSALVLQDGEFPASGTSEQQDRVFAATESPASVPLVIPLMPAASVARDGVWGTALATNARLVRVVVDLSVDAGMRRMVRLGVRTQPSNVSPSSWMALTGMALVVEGRAFVARGMGRVAGAGGGSP